MDRWEFVIEIYRIPLIIIKTLVCFTPIDLSSKVTHTRPTPPEPLQVIETLKLLHQNKKTVLKTIKSAFVCRHFEELPAYCLLAKGQSKCHIHWRLFNIEHLDAVSTTTKRNCYGKLILCCIFVFRKHVVKKYQHWLRYITYTWRTSPQERIDPFCHRLYVVAIET